MNWLWPRHLHTETTALIRLGRVLHRTGISLGVLVALFAMLVFDDMSEGMKALTVAVAPALIGRAVRYILANE